MTTTSNIGAESPDPTGGADASNAAAFTPGPWRVGKTFAAYGLDDNDYPCAQIDLPPEEGEIDYHAGAIEIWSIRCEANAHLIAAAPELLAALTDSLIMIGRLKKHCQITDNAGYTPDGRMLRLTEVESVARAALNKALGK